MVVKTVIGLLVSAWRRASDCLAAVAQTGAVRRPAIGVVIGLAAVVCLSACGGSIGGGAGGAAARPPVGIWVATGGGGASATFVVERVGGRLVLDDYAQFCGGQEGRAVEDQLYHSGTWPGLQPDDVKLATVGDNADALYTGGWGSPPRRFSASQLAYGARRLHEAYTYPISSDGTIEQAPYLYHPGVPGEPPDNSAIGYATRRAVQGKLGPRGGWIVGDYGRSDTDVALDNAQAGPHKEPACGQRVRMYARPVRAVAVRDGEWKLSGPWASAVVGVGAAGRLIGMDKASFSGPPVFRNGLPLNTGMGSVACGGGANGAGAAASAAASLMNGPPDYPPEDAPLTLFYSGWLIHPNGSFRIADHDWQQGPPTSFYPIKSADLTVQGQFTSATTATGTYTYSVTGIRSYLNCSSGPWPFTMTLERGTPEPAGPLPPNTAPSPPPPIRYVALGDSFSSGEGAGNYTTGTDTAGNLCHRTASAYPPLFANAYPKSQAPASRSVSLSFWACSGARTANVLTAGQGKAKDEAPQIQHLDASTDLVTITIGGNDAGFAQMLFVCSRALPRPIRRIRCNSNYAAKRIAALTEPLERTFAKIRARAPHAAVIALDYPQLFPASPAEQRCPALRPWAPAEQHVLRGAADELDGEIAQAAATTGVQFLDVRSEFAGHAVCDAQPWIVPPNIASLRRMARSLRLDTEPFHPTAAGQQDGYLSALQHYIEHDRQQHIALTAAGLPANPSPAP